MERAKLVIPKIPKELFLSFSDEQQKEYLRLYREQVAPKFEEWRNPAPVKIAYGGRGAGAKSESTASLLVQFAEHPSYFGDKIKVICLRSVQKSIKDSSYSLLCRKIEELGYTDFDVTNNYIRNTTNGSYFIFNGLNDFSASQLKSLDAYTIAFVEEADGVSLDVWNTLEATIRKEWYHDGKKLQAEIWAVYNPNTNNDPITQKFVKNPKSDWLITKCEGLTVDNPWFPDNLVEKYEQMRAVDEDEANHVYLGYPRNGTEQTAWKYSDLEGARDRTIPSQMEGGTVEIGVDVARFGKDKSVVYKRKGLRVVDMASVSGYNTQDVAGLVWDMAEKNPEVLIKIDIGYNPAVFDLLQEWGANVVPVNFGGKAQKSDVYANCAAEMLFSLPMSELSVPSEFLHPELVEGLCERRFFYNSRGQKQLEPKDGQNGSGQNYKRRHGGKSPDYADAFCLCFYETRNDEVF